MSINPLSVNNNGNNGNNVNQNKTSAKSAGNSDFARVLEQAAGGDANVAALKSKYDFNHMKIGSEQERNFLRDITEAGIIGAEDVNYIHAIAPIEENVMNIGYFAGLQHMSDCLRERVTHYQNTCKSEDEAVYAEMMKAFSEENNRVLGLLKVFI